MSAAAGSNELSTGLVPAAGDGDVVGAGRLRRVFDRVTNLDGVPDGYRAMNERQSNKVMIEF